MKADNFLHPLLPSGGTVRVDVHPLGHLGVRLPCHHPPAMGWNENIYEILSESVTAVTNGRRAGNPEQVNTGIRARGEIVEIKKFPAERLDLAWRGEDVWQTRDNIESQ